MRTSAIIGIVLASATVTQALSYIGPPTTVMKARQFAIGASYAESEQDVKLGDDVLSEIGLDTLLATVAVGLADHRAEFFGRVGVSEYRWLGQDSGDEFAVGFGGRVTTNIGRDELEGLDFGLALHMMYYDIPVEVGEGELYEFQLGFGPCWRPGAFILYGGGMVHLVGGSVEILGDDYDIRQESAFGVYIGTGVDLQEHVALTAELQATPDATCVAVGGRFTF